MSYPLNHTKLHEESNSFRVASCVFVDSLSSFSYAELAFIFMPER